nr:MAG TPA: hypothetical protein [Inoviridae sp.]
MPFYVPPFASLKKLFKKALRGLDSPKANDSFNLPSNSKAKT